MNREPHPVARLWKFWKVIWSVLTTLLVIIVVLLAVALVGVRLLGYTPYAILSPSMTPDYQVGDLVYVKSVEPEHIMVGDVLTFVANEELVVVTHRVDEADRENRLFYTKGDANESRDSAPVLYENVIGVVKFSLPMLGYVSTYFTSTSGRFAGMALVFFLILLYIIPELIKSGKKQKDE